MATSLTNKIQFTACNLEEQRGYLTTLHLFIPAAAFRAGPDELAKVADEFRSKLLMQLEQFYYKEGDKKW